MCRWRSEKPMAGVRRLGAWNAPAARVGPIAGGDDRVVRRPLPDEVPRRPGPDVLHRPRLEADEAAAGRSRIRPWTVSSTGLTSRPAEGAFTP